MHNTLRRARYVVSCLAFLIFDTVANGARLDVRVEDGLGFLSSTQFNGDPSTPGQPLIEGWHYGVGVNYEPLTFKQFGGIVGVHLTRIFAPSKLLDQDGNVYLAAFNLNFLQFQLGPVVRFNDSVWSSLEIGYGQNFASHYELKLENESGKSAINGNRSFAQLVTGFDIDASSLFSFGAILGFEALNGEIVPKGETATTSVFASQQAYAQLFLEFRFINQPSAVVQKQRDEEKMPKGPKPTPRPQDYSEDHGF